MAHSKNQMKALAARIRDVQRHRASGGMRPSIHQTATESHLRDTMATLLEEATAMLDARDEEKAELEGKLSLRNGELEAKTVIISKLERTVGDLLPSGSGRIHREGREPVGVEELEELERSVRQLQRFLHSRDMRIERLKGTMHHRHEAAGRNHARYLEKCREARELRAEVENLRRAVNPRKFSYEGDVRIHLGFDDRIPFGQKHRGETVALVVATDPDYLMWMLREHSSHRPTNEVAQAAIDLMAGKVLRLVDIESQPDAIVVHNGVAHAVEYKTGPGISEQLKRYATGMRHQGERPRTQAEDDSYHGDSGPFHHWLGGER